MNKTGYYETADPRMCKRWVRQKDKIIWSGRGGLWYEWDKKPISRLARNKKDGVSSYCSVEKRPNSEVS